MTDNDPTPDPMQLKDDELQLFDLLFSQTRPALMTVRYDDEVRAILCATWEDGDDVVFQPVAMLLTQEEIERIEVPEGAEEVRR